MNDTKMIVILDDQLVNLEATKLVLLDFGCKAQIQLFTSSLAAIDFIMHYTLQQKSRKTIDLLITEFQMPEMTGIEVINEISTFLQLMIVRG